MARETKQERIVRGMLDQVTEHLHELKTLDNTPTTKELDVERWCQSVLRNCLGFTASAGYSIRAQESKGKMRPDLVVFKDEKPIFVVEVKKLGFDLNRSDFRSGKVQLKEYLKMIGEVRWGILSNGYEWKLYDFSNPSAGGIEVAAMDIKGDSDTLELTKKACEELSWEWLDMHESSFSGGNWEDLSKEATAFSPDSLARAILSADVIKHIARVIRGEHEYKANMEILTDKVYQLLEEGLDDSIPGWNETLAAEFHKYLKSQKRISRRGRKTASKANAPASSDVSPSDPTPEDPHLIPPTGESSKVA